jgi:hypothetical protein
MRGFRFIATLSALLFPVLGHANPVTDYPITKQPVTGPAWAIEAYAQAFRDRSSAGIDAVLTADYTFHSSQFAAGYVNGNARQNELETADNMLNGLKRDGVVIFTPPQSVSMSVDGVSDNIDPEHADSTQHYRVLTVTRLGFEIVRDSTTKMTSAPSVHVIHVVRGDAALLMPGQTADPKRWYIRRWLEDIRGLNAQLREKKGECGDEPAAEPGTASAGLPELPSVLVVRPLTNPACAAMRLQLELPGHEDAKVQVYDVSGRLVNERKLRAPSPGTQSIDAGTGAQILPGIYWVRVEQAKRRPGVRMVVVAR